MSTNSLRSSVQRTQQALLRAQTEISTGKKVNKPSDSPRDLATIQILHEMLENRDQWERNLDHAQGLLDSTDGALDDVTAILLEAKSVASSQVGIGSTAEGRANQATVIDGQMRALMEIVNRKVAGVALFGGNSSGNGEQVFVEALGGVRYVGSEANLESLVGLLEPIGLNTNGKDAFGALSARVVSQIDLDPQATADTRLVDINGAQGHGFRNGPVELTVDGTKVTVDLTTAETMGDVVTRINNAITGVDPAAGSLAISGSGFALTAGVGHTISLGDIGEGEAAGDLGLALSASDATVQGGDVDVRLTLRTAIGALGPSIDFASGLKITQGEQTKVADFSSASTVQDLINEINRLELGLRMEINEEGRSLELVSEVSGIELSIGENAGGTTATDLGVRTFGAQTRLDDFQFGIRGVNAELGKDDFEIRLHDGRTFAVNLDGATTVQDVLDIMTSAAGAAGLTVGAPGSTGSDVNIGLAVDGNGFQIDDNTTGVSPFEVKNLNNSLAAVDLGIYQQPGGGSSLVGEDLAKVRVDSLFTNLISLRNSLMQDDSDGITFAGSGIDDAMERIARVRADVGVRAQRVAQQLERSAEVRIAESSLLSGLEDADFAEVATRYSQLTQQLQATFQVGAASLQTSLLDFLR